MSTNYILSPVRIFLITDLLLVVQILVHISVVAFFVDVCYCFIEDVLWNFISYGNLEVMNNVLQPVFEFCPVST